MSKLGLKVFALCIAVLVLLETREQALAQATPRTDLLLVLAVDVSLSMDLEEQRLQRDG